MARKREPASQESDSLGGKLGVQGAPALLPHQEPLRWPWTQKLNQLLSPEPPIPSSPWNVGPMALLG